MKSGEKITCSIYELGKHGEGVSRLNGRPLFVDGALPGEQVSAAITLVKSTYVKANLVTIDSAHADRVSPPCVRARECGGCQVMHLSYGAQLNAKTQILKDALHDLHGFNAHHLVNSCIASPKAFHYRNKIQLPVAKKDGVIVTGFFARGSHEIVPYEHCLVHHASMEQTVHAMQKLFAESAIEPYQESTTEGTLRHFVIRANAQHEQLVGLVTTGNQSDAVLKLAREIMMHIPNVVGVVENVNTKPHNAILGDTTKTLVGSSSLTEEIDGLQFAISLPSFFQVNLSTAKILYQTALKYAQLTKEARVLDAYCGIGTLSLLAARQAKSVIGAECVERAVLDARDNARANQIDNAEFVVAQVEQRTELFTDVDVAFINPPRTGVDAAVVQALNEFGPPRLIYISCNPATLARDARLLTHYRLKAVQPIDMFPQTMHVEAVTCFERKIL